MPMQSSPLSLQPWLLLSAVLSRRSGTVSRLHTPSNGSCTSLPADPFTRSVPSKKVKPLQLTTWRCSGVENWRLAWSRSIGTRFLGVRRIGTLQREAPLKQATAALRLRKATIEDGLFLLALRNADDVRSQSKAQEVIHEETHRNWLQKNLT